MPKVKPRLRLRARSNISDRTAGGRRTANRFGVQRDTGDIMKTSLDATVLKQVETEVRNIKNEFRGVVPEE